MNLAPLLAGSAMGLDLSDHPFLRESAAKAPTPTTPIPDLASVGFALVFPEGSSLPSAVILPFKEIETLNFESIFLKDKFELPRRGVGLFRRLSVGGEVNLFRLD